MFIQLYDKYIYIQISHKIERYVFIKENIDTKLRFQNYFQLHTPSQQERAKVIADSNTPKLGKLKNKLNLQLRFSVTLMIEL